MKVLILGSDGMAGHMISQYFINRTSYDVYTTSRTGSNGAFLLDVRNEIKLELLIRVIKPEVVINCIGILNEKAAQQPCEAIRINSMLPYQITALLNQYGGQLIQISTDCVFSGEKGDYTEHDSPDGTSFYARTKMLGEIHSSDHLTIRTSIIGPERKEGIGLLQWFLKQQGNINGYTEVYWNGVTTLELAKACEQAIKQNIKGLYHLTAPQKTSKYDLLHMFQKTFFTQNIQIIPYNKIKLDRTLKNTRTDFLYHVPDYPKMMEELRGWMTESGV